MNVKEATLADRDVACDDEFAQRDRSVHPPAFAPEYKTSVLRSPRLSSLSLQNSLSELTGPVFGDMVLRGRRSTLFENKLQGS
jgi:protocatechuate 3,4-dioxygenase, beta subunit